MVLFIDDISSKQILLTPDQSDHKRTDLWDVFNDDDSDTVKTVPLHMNITDLYQICKKYNQANQSPDVINDQTGRILRPDSVTSRDRTAINQGSIMHLVEEHMRLSKRETTTMAPVYSKHKVKDKVNTEKTQALGKVVMVSPGGAAPTGTPQGSKSAEAPEVFPEKTGPGAIVVSVEGNKPVDAPSPDTHAADNFPSNPEYNLASMTEHNLVTIRKKIAVLMDLINQSVERNNSHNMLTSGMAAVNLTNDLKNSLDHWIRGMSTANKTTYSDIEEQNITLKNKLLSSKVQNKTDPTEILCMINNLYEEIYNVTNIKVEFDIVVDNEELKSSNCSDSSNCTIDGLSEEAVHVETEDIDNLKFDPGWVGILAICFAVISIVSYVGLITWRYILEKRYGTRQLLVNDEAEYYDSAPDILPFEVRSEQL
ncbi:hypothetical protein M8J76_010478 [Diaphorina citri]|nr:hypothetical protein M8J76_010478 [Diaphorina citri]